MAPPATTAPPSGYLDDDSLIARVLDHVEAGTTDLAEGTWREPVANYLSPDRLEREIELVLRRLPVPFCPSAALPEPGTYAARDAAGTPLVLTRDRDGSVRAFRNACRHRGATIVSGAGRAPSLVCPYHGWVYQLDGSLRLVPHDDGFPDLDPAQRGLVPVAAIEHGGLIYVDQSLPAATTIDTSGLPAPITADQRLLDTTETELDVNWKVYAEGFLEGYHIKPTHRESFFPFGYDNLTVVETWGRHHRVTFPFRRIESLAGKPRSEWSIERMATLVYHVFPNVIVARLSHHTTVVVIEPLAPDRTRVVSYELTGRPSAGSGSEAERDARRDAEFVRQGATEDQAVVAAVQHGLRSGANDVLEFGRFEGAISDFHRQLAALVGSPLTRQRLPPLAGNDLSTPNW